MKKPTHRIAALCAAGLLAVAGFAGFAAPASAMPATTLEVGGSGTYATIALALAAAVDGDTIVVNDGTYPENVVLDKVVTLVASDPGTSAVIAGRVTVNAAATITGFEVAPTSGNGISVNAGGAGSTISDNTVQGAKDLITVTGAIGSTSEPTTIKDNALSDFPGPSNAVFINDSSFVNVTGNTVSDTPVVASGSVGIQAAGGSNNLTISNNSITGTENGVAIIAVTGPPVADVSITSNTISNTIYSGVVVQEANVQSLSITKNTFTNIASGTPTAGAVQLGITGYAAPVGAPAIDRLLIDGNHVTTAPNGVVLEGNVKLVDDASATISNNVFAAVSGDAISVAPTVTASVAAPGNDFGGAPISGAVVVPSSSTTPPPTPPGTTSPNSSEPTLAYTGTNPIPLFIAAVIALLTGLSFLVWRRRYRLRSGPYRLTDIEDRA